VLSTAVSAVVVFPWFLKLVREHLGVRWRDLAVRAWLPAYVIGAGVAVVITRVYDGLRAEADNKARLVAELTAAQEQLAATERRAGTLAERTRLARELHDTVAQSLSSIVLLLRSARASTPPGTTPEPVTTALGVARGALDDTRRIVRALTPAELSERPLDEGLRRALGPLEHAGVRTSMTVDGERTDLPTPVAVALLRVAQGALANVTAHAAATRVAVTLTYQPDGVRLDVADDGRGFEPAQPARTASTGTGVGLAAMRTRLADVGGTLVVESAPGAGTAISATIPTAPRATAAREPMGAVDG
jgi:signal transduction histidine kinase